MTTGALAAGSLEASPRERVNFDADWRFTLGHAADVERDFGYATGTFSHFAKAGFGAGAAAADFDDRDWCRLDLPHDWAVELPFDPRGSGSHGFKAIGRAFPEHSVGWYRKRFTIPASDLGKRISIEFDGVFRDSVVWINGHYLGTEESGYSDFAYNLTEALNYGGENVLVVRVDASLEEGWFYEGAGIYRHVWLTKTDPLHFARHGIAVTTEVGEGAADVLVRTSITNEDRGDRSARLEASILDAAGQVVARSPAVAVELAAAESRELPIRFTVPSPQLWSLESPQLYTLVTTLVADGRELDREATPFGIRTIAFDPERGFLLNGERVQLKGTNNHQDHAGLGVALPDAMHAWRLRQLKAMGGNAYRVSHHPASRELLDACDRLGVLVIDENRLMGTSAYHFDRLARLVRRNRNHPGVILWSIGNEEWGIEGSAKGEHIVTALQDFVHRLDPTRPVIAAISGGWGNGISLGIEVAGVNYLDNLAKGGFTTDSWRAAHPDQPLVGTEECAIHNTRGVYVDDRERAHLNAYDWDPSDWGSPVMYAWKHYAERPWLAGVFLWTGFDYRGEPTPFGWPAISSQFGILDTCGFPKDAFHYLRAWWSDEPVLHVFPHWNWPGREGEEIDVWVYGNDDAVELFQDGRSLGRRPMERNGHLAWPVVYTPGVLEARGYRDGRLSQTTRIETTGPAAQLVLTPDRPTISADGADVVVIAVSSVDAQGRHVPTAGNLVHFAVTGGRVIGVGNGDPSCHESDKASQRSLFNGFAQVIVQATREPGEICLIARADGLTSAEAVIMAQPLVERPANAVAAE